MTTDINLQAIQPFSPDRDIPRILSLRMAAEAVDQDGIEISEQVLRLQLNLPGHDPLHDRWVIENPDDPSTLVASALIRRPPGADTADANVLVHPDFRQRGLGTALLDRITDRARQLGVGAIQIYANARHMQASAFLHANGFFSLGAYTELRLSAGVRLPPVIWPYGYTLRTYAEVQDLSVLAQAMNLAYIPLWGHQEVTEEEMSSWLPDFNPQGIFLVFSEKGRVIGISRTEPSPECSQVNGEPTGYIDAPGIVPQHRRLDLYRALVLTGIRWLRDQGQVLIEMESWGDKLEVLKMYRELGFIDKRQLVCYELKLTGNQN
ncbi:MAG TPA: GNAT family N-acetyltransferase [Anaerolineales bacterium]